MSIESSSEYVPQQYREAKKPLSENDKSRERSLINWEKRLSPEQQSLRGEIRRGVQEHKTINLGRALEKLLTPAERDKWDNYIDQSMKGDKLTPVMMRDFQELGVKLGIKEKIFEPPLTTTAKEVQDKEIEAKESEKKARLFALDVFDAKKLKDPKEVNKLSSEKLKDHTFLYRGVKGKWKKPNLSRIEFDKLYDEFDDLLGHLVEGKITVPKERRQKGQRVSKLYNRIRYQGGQWFSDNIEQALSYAGDKGQLVRIAVDIGDVFPYMRETGMTPGGFGSSFIVPREWFVDYKTSSLAQLKKIIKGIIKSA